MSSSVRSRPATTRPSASAARSFQAANASASRLRGPWSRTRRSSCWTKRPRPCASDARIRAWVSSVSEEGVRALDHRLLLDLLKIEARTDAWAGVLDLTISFIEQLVLVGDLALAAQLVDAVVAASKGTDATNAAYAEAGVTRLVEGALVRHLALFLRQATDAEVGLATQICRTLGPALVEPLADALAAEDNARTVRRLRDILIGFGTAARQYANELRTSPNPAVRRAAVDLLRALGGEAEQVTPTELGQPGR